MRYTRVLLVAVLLVLLSASAVRAEIITVPFASFGGNAVVIEYDHNTGNGNVLRFRCFNNSQYDAWFAVKRCDYEAGTCVILGERICAAYSTIEQNVPGVTMFYACVPYPDHPEWPPDCGLVMGDLQFHARWPAY